VTERLVAEGVEFEAEKDQRPDEAEAEHWNGAQRREPDDCVEEQRPCQDAEHPDRAQVDLRLHGLWPCLPSAFPLTHAEVPRDQDAGAEGNEGEGDGNSCAYGLGASRPARHVGHGDSPVGLEKEAGQLSLASGVPRGPG